LKKHLLLVSIIAYICFAKATAQNISVPNNSFEVWDTLAALTVPDSWPSSDLLWYYDGYNTHNVYPDAHHNSGKYSASIGPDTADRKILPGFIASKFSIFQRARYFSLHYIDSLNSAESGVVQVTLYKWDVTTKTEDSIGGASWNFPDTTVSQFVFAEIPLTYTSSDTTITPDSVSINIEVVSTATALPSGHIAVDDVGLSVNHSASIQVPVVSDVFHVFPNPSNGLVYINSSGILNGLSKVEISDLNGRIVYSQYKDIGTSNPIDLSENSPGIYFIKVLSGDEVSVNKIIINR